MSIDQRSQTSAANGRLSKGPITPAGKRRSSLNSIRHGLLARCLVLEDESPEAFKLLHAYHIQRLQPVDGVEIAIVEEMTASMWRLRRSWAIETHMLDSASAAPQAPTEPLARITAAFTSRAESVALPLAHRYETRLHMIYQRALRNLLLLRSAIPSQPTGPDEEPELPAGTELPNEPNHLV